MKETQTAYSMMQEPDGCYMVTGLEEGADEQEQFALKMLSENRIGSLIKPRLRSFNGRQSLYYEITALQSLDAKCRMSPLNGEEIYALLAALLTLSRQLPEFFLSPAALILSGNGIYTDGKEWYFCYRPGRENSPLAVSEFASLLIGSIDHEDELAVVYAYQFYKCAQDEGMGLTRILERALQTKAEEPKEGKPADIEMQEESNAKQTKEEPGAGERQEQKEKGERQKTAGGMDFPAIVSFSLLLILGVFLLIWRGSHIEPFSLSLLCSGQEGVGGLCFLVSGIGGILFSLFFSGKG